MSERAKKVEKETINDEKKKTSKTAKVSESKASTSKAKTKKVTKEETSQEKTRKNSAVDKKKATKKTTSQTSKDEGIVIDIDDSRRNNTEEERKRQQENLLKMQQRVQARKHVQDENDNLNNSSDVKAKNQELKGKQKNKTGQSEDKKNQEKSETATVKQPNKNQEKSETATVKANNNQENHKNRLKKRKKKKAIELNIGTVAFVFITFALILANVRLAISSYKEKIENDKISQSLINQSNTGEQTYESQEIGRVINLTDSLATQIVEKLTMAPYATASIYGKGTLNKGEIPNDLILRLGWENIIPENIIRTVSEDGETIETATEKNMEESIKSIFGEDVTYINQSFILADIEQFAKYNKNKGDVEYSNETYTALVNEETGSSPIIYQSIEKIVQYDDKIKVQVKTAFIDINDGKFTVYRSFNNGFFGKVLETTQDGIFENGYFNQETGDGTVVIKDSSSMSNIKEQLRTYVYTFQLDSVTGECYLSEFTEKT